MHITDGVLSIPVLAAGATLSGVGVWIGLNRLDYNRMMTTAALASVFFVGSLVHVPIGPSSVHLLLNGLAGMVLGWTAFPCILVALFLQAILFQFGGLMVLGVNTLNVALPAALCGALLRPMLAQGGKKAALAGLLGGAGSVLGTALMVALSLAFTDEGFLTTAKLVIAAHLPVVAVEGVTTMFAVGFLARACPGVLGAALPPAKGAEVAAC